MVPGLGGALAVKASAVTLKCCGVPLNPRITPLKVGALKVP
jgi:hypothetical protein